MGDSLKSGLEKTLMVIGFPRSAILIPDSGVAEALPPTSRGDNHGDFGPNLSVVADMLCACEAGCHDCRQLRKLIVPMYW